MKVLVTGYAGFIGSNLTRRLIQQGDCRVFGLDAMTYAARPDWVWEALTDEPSDFFTAVQCDLRNAKSTLRAIDQIQPDLVYHLAAESHVCKSIDGPRAFIESNINGTFNLLEALRETRFKGRLVHISTDEAFGQLRMSDEPFDENTAIRPTSPYAASKAASDLLVQSWVHTYGLNACITRCTNNYGPNQHGEKLIPKIISTLKAGEPMTMYGDGTNRRDWIFVDDHCDALQIVMMKGQPGLTYCVGSGLELSNLEVLDHVSNVMLDNRIIEAPVRFNFTNSRPTDDRRYAVDTSRLQRLGWKPNASLQYFRDQILRTIRWYA